MNIRGKLLNWRTLSVSMMLEARGFILGQAQGEIFQRFTAQRESSYRIGERESKNKQLRRNMGYEATA